MGRQNVKNGLLNGGIFFLQKFIFFVYQLLKEYDYDRIVSYRQVITNQYFDEVKKLVEVKIEERYLFGFRIIYNSLVKDVKVERFNSVFLQSGRDGGGRFILIKRFVGGSIGNFFRKLFFRFGRKFYKDKGFILSMDIVGLQ